MSDTSFAEHRLDQPAIAISLKTSNRVTTLARAYLQLTKPTIMLLVLVTGATALVLEGSFLRQPIDFLLVMIGLYLTGGSANALNQYFERDVDAQMRRTARRRPLPQGIISPISALVFSVGIGIIGVALFWYFFNALTAALSLATILFYSLFYTLYLKPNTHLNIVVGGAAGAMAPVGAWTAATGEMALMPWVIFAIIFFWTPPHFWALALFCKDDYREVGYPMLPNLKGDTVTYNQILGYSVVLGFLSMIPLFLGSALFYGVIASILSFLFVRHAVIARKRTRMEQARKLFGFSLVYLFAICIALVVDKLIVG